MTSPPSDDFSEPGSRRGAFGYTALRLFGALGIVLLIALAIYLLPALVFGSNAGAGTVSVGFLLITPVCLGAIASLLSDMPGNRSMLYHTLKLPLLLAAIVSAFGLLILREGMICVVMLLPLWLPAISLGGYLVKRLHRRFHAKYSVHTTFLTGLAALATLAGPAPFSAEQVYRVESSLIIAASPENIWPHLESLTGLSPEEGRWNITQDLLQVPRPVSARLEGQGIGAIRYAEWDSGITFEEHITEYVPNREMRWHFVFPDPTLHHHVDRHIDPNGDHLNVRSGGYTLEPLSEGRTRLHLHTEITLNTQLNAYPALWANFMLGDIQKNILTLIRDRAE